MKRYSTVTAAGLLLLAVTGGATADDAALEKKNIVIAVGGSISQMNKVAYAIALARKYFEQEGLTVDSTAFASGTAGLQSLVAGGADSALARSDAAPAPAAETTPRNIVRPRPECMKGVMARPAGICGCSARPSALLTISAGRVAAPIAIVGGSSPGTLS